jgi:hypothetical protein
MVARESWTEFRGDVDVLRMALLAHGGDLEV